MSPEPDLTTWCVLSRTDCSLCEAMLTALCQLFGARAECIQVRDIEGDPLLESKYGQRLPVLLIDGEFVCAYHLDRARLAAYLPEAAS